MKATIGFLDPTLQPIAENIMKGFARGAVDVSAVDGAVYVHGEIPSLQKPYLEAAFADTNTRFAKSALTLAMGN